MGCLVSLDGAKCVSDKFKDDLGYTPPCSQCMGALAQCTKNKCLMVCLGTNEDACNTCVTDGCSPAFNACSGLPDSDTNDSTRSR